MVSSRSALSEAAAFVALPGLERRLLVRGAASLPVSTALLRSVGYRRTRAWLQRLTPEPPAPDDAAAVADAAGRMMAVAAAHSPLQSTCLGRSVALWWVLAAAGVESEIRIGVRKAPDDLEAHAWVEHAGRPVAGQSGQDFQALT